MEIREIVNNKEKYMDLLLEADPSKKMIQKYLAQGKMYGVFEENEILAEAVVRELNDKVCELKNIATKKEARGKGIGLNLIKYIFKEYEKKYEEILVGTTEVMIPYYVKAGFNKYSHKINNFFIDNYKEPIFEENNQCKDMLYLSKKFDKIEYTIKPITKEIRNEINSILIDEWESTNIIVRGKIIDGTILDGFVAMKNNNIIGLITYKIEESECEIISLNSFIKNKGIATSLIERTKQIANANKCDRLKLITTNDNIKAMEFYQKRGFVFSNLYINAIETSRKLKPQIPLYAENGLPIRDEIEFEMKL